MTNQTFRPGPEQVAPSYTRYYSAGQEATPAEIQPEPEQDTPPASFPWWKIAPVIFLVVQLFIELAKITA